MPFNPSNLLLDSSPIADTTTQQAKSSASLDVFSPFNFSSAGAAISSGEDKTNTIQRVVTGIVALAAIAAVVTVGRRFL